MAQAFSRTILHRPKASLLIFLGTTILIGLLIPVSNSPLLWIGLGLASLSLPTLVFVRQITRVSTIKLIGLAYFFLFGLSQSTFGRVTIGGVELPIYFSLLPFILMFFFLVKLKRERLASTQYRRSLVLILVSLLFAVAISVFGSRDVVRSITELVRFAVSVSAMALIVSLQWQQSDWQHFVWAYIVGIGLTTSIALFYFHFSPLHNYRLAISAEVDRANQLAFMLHTPIIYYFVKTFLTSSYRSFLFSLAGLGFFGYSILLTASRGGWLALFLALLTVIFLSRHRIHWGRLIIVSILGAAAASQLVSNVILLRIQAIFNPSIVFTTASDQNISLGGASNQGRLLILRQYLDIVRENPLTGIGVGVTVETERGVKSAHNSYVSVWATAGISALIAFLTFLSYVGSKVFLAKKPQNQMLTFSSGLFVTVVVHSIFENFVFAHFFWGNLTFVIMALLIHLREGAEPSQTS